MLPLNVHDAALLSTATVSLAAASSAEFIVTPLFMPEADYRTVEQQGVLVTVCWLVSGQARLLLGCVHPLCWLVSPIPLSWTLYSMLHCYCHSDQRSTYSYVVCTYLHPGPIRGVTPDDNTYRSTLSL